MPPKPAQTVQKTRNFDFLFGRYHHAECTIPYFQVSMNFSDAAKYLKLVNEMPGAASMDWKIQELFQRDIDWPRVERKIVPYLRNSNKPQFFNSLTISLLPIRAGKLQSYHSEGWQAPALERSEDFAEGIIRSYGPITAGYWGAWDDPSEDNAKLGQLCWNSHEVCGVAIDGQHRLAAIKNLVGPDDSIHRASSVPVILIVLDPALGFKGGTTAEELIETLRELFIDLNKHAEKVKRARQILLDDRDPSSICVRTLVGEKLEKGESELNRNPPRLPLTLIDWHSEQAKFDSGPYISTILGLDWAIAKILGVKPFEDPMAFDLITKMIDRLETKLDIELLAAKTRLEECRRHERPFGFDDGDTDELKSISDAFAAKWSKPLTHLCSNFSPYEDFIQARLRHRTLCPEFANWYALKQSADEAGSGGRAAKLFEDLEHSLKNRDPEPIVTSDYHEAIKEYDQIKYEKQLAFTVVFQRALFLAYIHFTKVSSWMIEEAGDEEEYDLEAITEDEVVEVEEATSEENERACQMVDALNAVFAQCPDLYKVGAEFNWFDNELNFDRFWLWSFASPEGNIDFTQAASKRASDWLLLMAILWVYKQSGADLDQILEKCKDADSGLALKLRQCLTRLSSSTRSLAEKILLSRELDADDEDLKWREIEGRTRWIWQLMCAKNDA